MFTTKNSLWTFQLGKNRLCDRPKSCPRPQKYRKYCFLPSSCRHLIFIHFYFHSLLSFLSFKRRPSERRKRLNWCRMIYRWEKNVLIEFFSLYVCGQWSYNRILCEQFSWHRIHLNIEWKQTYETNRLPKDWCSPQKLSKIKSNEIENWLKEKKTRMKKLYGIDSSTSARLFRLNLNSTRRNNHQIRRKALHNFTQNYERNEKKLWFDSIEFYKAWYMGVYFFSRRNHNLRRIH